MTVPLFRSGKVLLTSNGKLASTCAPDLSGAVRIIWQTIPAPDPTPTASISIPSTYFLFEDHYDGQYWWGIDFQAIYEADLFDEDGEYTFTVTCSNMPAVSDLNVSFANGSASDSEQVVPAASKTVTVKLDGTISIS